MAWKDFVLGAMATYSLSCRSPDGDGAKTLLNGICVRPYFNDEVQERMK